MVTSRKICFFLSWMLSASHINCFFVSRRGRRQNVGIFKSKDNGITPSIFFQNYPSSHLFHLQGTSSDTNEEEEEEDHELESWWDTFTTTRRIEDSGILIGDLFSIAIASQLMGLLDVVNDPQFVQSGGWLQPIPAVPSTLGTLIERISTLSLVWILAAISEENTFTTDAVKDEKVSILVALSIVLNFVLLRIILGWIYAFVMHADVSWGLLIRDCYFVAWFYLDLGSCTVNIIDKIND